MGRMKHINSGVGIVELLVIIAALGVIGAGGWFVYQHNRTKPVDAAINSQPSQQTATATTTPITAATLDIKEWGVRLPLSNPIKDAYYVVATNSTDTMWLGLKSLDSAGCAADLGNTQGASAVIAAIIRVLPTDKDPVKGILYTQLYPGRTIDGHYYAYMAHPNNQCVSTTSHASVDAAFEVAAENIVSATAAAN